MKLKQLRIARGRQQKELALKIGTDEPMMSKFENYKCLPVPSMMKLLTEELGVSVDDIYEPHEVYYQGARAKGSAPKKKTEEEVYHLTVNLPPEAREFFKTALTGANTRKAEDFTALYMHWAGKPNTVFSAEKE